jgi:hypothetical protein
LIVVASLADSEDERRLAREEGRKNMRKEEGEGGGRGGREWDPLTIILRRWSRGGRGSLVWGREIEMRQQHSESRMAARVFNVQPGVAFRNGHNGYDSCCL